MSRAGRPNVILIMADQLRADGLGYAGNPIVRTPNIDRLAASGVVFDSAFTNCPVCMASRGAIHTGRYPSTIKMHSMGILMPDEVTLAETLRLQGYRTGLFGKLHFLPMVYTRDTLHYEYEPVDVEPYLESCGVQTAGTIAAVRDPHKHHYGFDVSRSVSDLGWGHYLDWLEEKSPEHVAVHESENWFSGRRPDTFGNAPARRMFYPDVPDFFDSNMEAEHHPSRFVADSAIDFIREQVGAGPAGSGAQPFFAHVSFVDPHHPFNAPAGAKEHYKPDDMPTPPPFDYDRCFPTGLAPALEAVNREYNRLPDELFRWARANYYAMIENVDAEIGRLMAALEELSILDDTLIVFTTDHGEHCGDHRLMYKGSQIFDGLMHVPLCYSWPGRIPVGRRTAMVEEVDIYPTILSLLGIDANPGVQGSDRTELLDGTTESGLERVLCEFDHLTPKHRAAYALRTEQWKLIYYPDVQTGMLFDLSEDPGELTNRFFDSACVDIRQKMMSELVDEINAQKDPLPIRLSKA